MTTRVVCIVLICYIVSIDIPVEPAAATSHRGSVDFIKYAYTLNGPPAYWTSNDTFGIVDVDNETKETIKKLVENTFDKDLIGKGVSHRFVNHTYLNVVNVKRVENPSLFSKYNNRRKEILGSRFSGVAPEVSSLKGSRGPVSTTRLLSPSMKEELYTEVNEHYFFHGTHVDNVDSIANNGFHIIRNVFHGAVYGVGIYGAESSQKSDNYASSKTDVFNMLLVRMTLGNIYSCINDSDRKNIILKDYLPPDGYDSVMSNFDLNDPTGLGYFREYIVYAEDQAYPEYIIEYTRKSSANKAVISFVNILFACVSIYLIKLTS